MHITISETVGWAGSLLYIVAYLLLSIKKLTSEDALYHLLNILGAVGLIINALHWGDLPSVAVNAIWFLIGAVAIILMFRKKHNSISRAV